MESKKFLSEFGSGIGDTILTFKGSYLFRIGEGCGESLDVKRPGVDMGVDTEIRCGSIKEGLRLLPALAGLEEFGADGIEFALGKGCNAFPGSCRKQFVKLIALLCKVAVSSIDHLEDILMHDLLHLLLFRRESVRIVVLVAGSQARCGCCKDKRKLKQLFHIQYY